MDKEKFHFTKTFLPDGCNRVDWWLKFLWVGVEPYFLGKASCLQLQYSSNASRHPAVLTLLQRW